jgi:hypothetical protein
MLRSPRVRQVLSGNFFNMLLTLIAVVAATHERLDADRIDGEP